MHAHGALVNFQMYANVSSQIIANLAASVKMKTFKKFLHESNLLCAAQLSKMFLGGFVFFLQFSI